MKKFGLLSVFTLLFLLMAANSNAQIVINIRYTGENGSARKYVEEMEKSGIADRIRAVEGCIRYDYFYPADDAEGLLLIDEWADNEALNRYHSSPMMQEAADLREKYKLGNRQINRYTPERPNRPNGGPNGAPNGGPNGAPNGQPGRPAGAPRQR